MAVQTETPSTKRGEEPIARAKALLQQGRVQESLDAVDSLLSDDPDHADALYIRAVCLRYLERYETAFEALRRLKRATPNSGRAHQEEAHLFRAMGDRPAALRCYRRATAANPALEASWRMQAELLKAIGDAAGAKQALTQADRLAGLPRALVSVSSFTHEGKLLKAERLCRAFLQKHPHHVEAMRLLADIGSRLNVLEDAEFLLESALEFEPENIQVRIDYMRVLRKRQKFEAALEQAKILLDKNPENPVFQSNYAVESQMAGNIDAALAMFDAVLEKLPEDPVTLISRGHALKTVGRQDEAIASYRAAYRAKPDHGDAYWSLANLKTYRFTEDELQRMEEQERSEDITFEDRIHLCFALGKAYEDRVEYQRSFRYYERGNALKKEQSRYRSDHMEEELRAQAVHCTADLFAAKKGMGHEAPDPIFIVGLPRAGSTLVEQILASHSQVDGTLELPNILALSHRLRGRQRITEEARYPKILRDLPADTLEEMGRAYIEDTRIHRRGAPFFTDKMPNNFRHIGLIALILPNAKIIDARREPMACCFSGFKQLFAEGQEFTYGLEEVGRYYRVYVDLMAHWDRVLPGRILRVFHEDVVDNLEREVRRILDFCDLPFEEACLEFHRTERAVRTASSEQVRRPIYRSGLEQWRHYEPFLDPLKDALGPALMQYRDG